MSQIGIQGTTVNADSGPYFSDEFKSEGGEAVITVDLTHLRGGPTVSFALQHRTATGTFSDAGTMTLTSTGPASMYINQIKPICRWRISLDGASFDSATLVIGSVGWFKTKECCGSCGGDGDCGCEESTCETARTVSVVDESAVLADAAHFLDWNTLVGQAAVQVGRFWFLAHLHDSLRRAEGRFPVDLASRLTRLVAGEFKRGRDGGR